MHPAVSYWTKEAERQLLMLVQRVAVEVKAITREAALARSMGGALCPLPWGALATSSSTWPHNFHTEIKIHCLFQNLCLFLMGE